MSAIEKTIKIIKRTARESLVDQEQSVLMTDKQSRREMVKVVASWIEERKELTKRARAEVADLVRATRQGAPAG